ncbi:PAS/PAC sensor hybrid histidine kinase [Caballeronia hypogeia]|uniref:histidine kinase n=1 Tax=Caballeronia hypogeia TaxID=1777140 RepID=A0A158A5X8_9BURK|nr:ATP-binding protein [Caballeronia hypogeia]SAK53109.1 PAS/PAC sensor hybrid histidine kinase [Caballeronia hypogeia]
MKPITLESPADSPAMPAPSRTPPQTGSQQDIIDILQADLSESRVLHDLCLHLLVNQDAAGFYQRAVEAAKQLLGSDFASIQLLSQREDGSEVLQLIAQHGFSPLARERWREVRADSTTSCGAAWANKERVVIADIENSDLLRGTTDYMIFRETGIRAMQTTPLRSRGGVLLGMLSTHWRAVHEPDVKQLRLLDVLARQAADLVERAVKEEALRVSESRFRALVTSASYSVYRMNADWTSMRALDGRGFLADTLSDSEEWLNTYIHPDDQPAVLNAIEAATSSQSLFELEHRVLRADGTFGWTSSRAVPIFDTAGQLAEWFGAATDVTARKDAERALRESETRLIEADRMKDRFLATLAHELRNPLAPIRNGLQILRVSKNADQSGNVLAMLDRQVDHMVRLVDDLMEVARVTSGTLELQRERIDLADALKSALELSRPAVEAGGHALQVCFAPERLFVDGDGVRLAQVFSNLINNAAKYSPTPGLIRVALTREGNGAMVRVTDDGIGIAPVDQGRLFTLFGRLRPSTAIGDGLGVGLALAKHLVELHGGAISVESRGAGAGSAFAVSLPLATCDETSTPIRELVDACAYDRLEVMVIDDNRDAADSLGAVLSLLGREASVFYGGADALRALERRKPALVLLDIGMPEMDGFAVAREIRASGRHDDVMLVAVTGWGQAEDRARTTAAGFDDHLVKPVDIDVLEGLLRLAAGRVEAL